MPHGWHFVVGTRVGTNGIIATSVPRRPEWQQLPANEDERLDALALLRLQLPNATADADLESLCQLIMTVMPWVAVTGMQILALCQVLSMTLRCS